MWKLVRIQDGIKRRLLRMVVDLLPEDEQPLLEGDVVEHSQGPVPLKVKDLALHLSFIVFRMGRCLNGISGYCTGHIDFETYLLYKSCFKYSHKSWVDCSLPFYFIIKGRYLKYNKINIEREPYL